MLEYLSGINFPRAENTCTRCTNTIVSLATDALSPAPYALIGLDAKKESQERVDDLHKIGSKIEELTEQLTMKIGKGSGVITKEPIYVKVVRPEGPTLTLIDIPGITHMCTDGVQANIHEVTKDMIESYIKSQNMVILVVIPATDDFGNAEALKLAKQYDPDGNRTLGVANKADLVKSDSDIVERIKMEGKNIQLALGFIALRCRTPSEVKSGVTREQAIESEAQLFTTHPLLSQLPSASWGLLMLVKQIVNIQADRVEAFVPEIKQLLNTKLITAMDELERLAPKCDSDAARTARMNERVRHVDLNLHDIISGARHLRQQQAPSTRPLGRPLRRLFPSSPQRNARLPGRRLHGEAQGQTQGGAGREPSKLHVKPDLQQEPRRRLLCQDHCLGSGQRRPDRCYQVHALPDAGWDARDDRGPG